LVSRVAPSALSRHLWTTRFEIDIVGFNIVRYTSRGERVQLKLTMIQCAECVTSLGHLYLAVVPKHRSGRDLFVEMVRANGTVLRFGPAMRQ
jgi:hypothetical protein